MTSTFNPAAGPFSPRNDEPYPNWNTSTISPNVAPTDRLFMITALIGTSTERNATASITPVTVRIRATSKGNCATSRSCTSSAAAV